MKKIYLTVVIIILLPLTSNAQWQKSFTGMHSAINEIIPVDDNVIWTIEQYNNQFAISSDGGQTWITKTFPDDMIANSIGGVYALSYSKAYTVVGSGENIGVYLTTDAGDSWTRQSAFDIYSAFANFVYFWDENDGMTLGDPTDEGYFEIYTTSNGGNNWQRVPDTNIPQSESEYTFNGNNSFKIVGNTIYFKTNRGRIFLSNDKGNTWEVIDTETQINSFAFGDELNGMVYSYLDGVPNIYSSSDGGNTFSLVNTTEKITDVEYSLSDNAYVATNANHTHGLSYSTDNGASWVVHPSFTNIRLVDVSITATGKVFVSDLDGNIYFSNNLTDPFFPGGVSCDNAKEVTTGKQHSNNENSEDQWFIYTAHKNGNIFIKSCGFTEEDTHVEVYDECSGNLIASSDNTCNLQSSVSFRSYQGETYYIKWASTNTIGSYDWQLIEGDITDNNLLPYQPQNNDHYFEDNIVIHSGYHPLNNLIDDAIIPSNSVYATFTFLNSGDDVIYQFISHEVYLDDVLIRTISNEYYLNPNNYWYHTGIFLGNNLTPGEHTVRIELDSDNYLSESNESDNSFSKTFNVVQPGNETCEEATEVTTGLNYTDINSSEQWYAYTSKHGGTVTISSCNRTEQDTRILIIKNGCEGTYVADSDDECNTQSSVTFEATKGQTYYIVWDNSYASESYSWEITETIPTSADAPDQDNNLLLYPNPTSGFVTLEVSDEFMNGQIRVLTTSGIVLSTYEVSDYKFDIEITGSQGIYLIEIISTDNKKEVHKIIKH